MLLVHLPAVSERVICSNPEFEHFAIATLIRIISIADFGRQNTELKFTQGQLHNSIYIFYLENLEKAKARTC